MRNVWTIASKDCRIYLTTSTSYVVFGTFLLIVGFFFQRLIVEYQFRAMQYVQMQSPGALDQMNLTDWVMGPLFQNITLFFLFMLPMITMRLFAEEKRHKTLELLMTQAVRPWEIVLGKYVAGLCMMAIMLGTTLLFPGLLQIFGGSPGHSALDWHSVATGYLGMTLLGAAFVAVGLCTSAMTDSQIVAVVTGFAALLLFYVIGLAARGQHGLWQATFQYLAINTHLEAFVRGIVRLCDVVYYLSLSIVSLCITYRIIEAQRWA